MVSSQRDHLLLGLNFEQRFRYRSTGTINLAGNTERLDSVTVNDPRRATVVARDSVADGQFFHSVETTGVYCRPFCAARRAGMRPCNGYRPDQASLAERHATLVAELCRFIENAKRIPNLQLLAEHAGLSRYHLHRLSNSISRSSVTDVSPERHAHVRAMRQFSVRANWMRNSRTRSSY